MGNLADGAGTRTDAREGKRGAVPMAENAVDGEASRGQRPGGRRYIGGRAPDRKVVI